MVTQFIRDNAFWIVCSGLASGGVSVWNVIQRPRNADDSPWADVVFLGIMSGPERARRGVAASCLTRVVAPHERPPETGGDPGGGVGRSGGPVTGLTSRGV